MKEIKTHVLFSPQLQQFVESIHFGNAYTGDEHMNYSINFTKDLEKAYINDKANLINLLNVLDQFSDNHIHLEIFHIE